MAEKITRIGQPFGKQEELVPYDLSVMTNLSPARTGIEGVVIYCGRANDSGSHSSYRVKVSIGRAWGATRKVFAMGTYGKQQGQWFAVRGSEYTKETDVPADILNGIRRFIELNQTLLKEWVEYDGLEDDSERFVPYVQSVAK